MMRPFGFSLARIEYDAAAMGEAAADALLSYLRTGVAPSGLSVAPVFRAGETL